MKDCLNEILITLFLGAVEEQRAIEVGGPVVKGREEEAQLGIAGHTVHAAAVEALLSRVIAKTWLRLLDGADGANQIGELGVAGIRMEAAVLSPEGDVVDIRRQQDQIADLRQTEAACNFFKQAVARVGVGQTLPQQFHQQSVFFSALDLSGRKAQLGERPAQGPGDALAQQLQIFFLLRNGKQGQRLVKLREDLTQGTHIAAEDMGDGCAVGTKTPPQLRKLFVDQGNSSTLYKVLAAL